MIIMSTNLNYKQVANVKRRTWDVEAYEQKAKARAEAHDAEAAAAAAGVDGRKGTTTTTTGSRKHPAAASAATTIHNDETATSSSTNKRFKLDETEEQKEEFMPAEPGRAGPAGSERAFLQPRKGKIDIDSKIGATEIISAEAAAKTSLNSDDGASAATKDAVTKSGVGWHCSVCDCFLKDSMTYLDHINGRKHQRKLGFSMRVERSTKDQMLGRLSQLTKEKERTEKKSQQQILLNQLEEGEESTTTTHYQDVVKAKDDDEARRRAEKAKRRQEKKKQKRAQGLGPVPKLEEGEKGEDDNNNKKKNGEDEEEEEFEEEGINPDMAAMMGFSGFG